MDRVHFGIYKRRLLYLCQKHALESIKDHPWQSLQFVHYSLHPLSSKRTLLLVDDSSRDLLIEATALNIGIRQKELNGLVVYSLNSHPLHSLTIISAYYTRVF